MKKICGLIIFLFAPFMAFSQGCNETNFRDYVYRLHSHFCNLYKSNFNGALLPGANLNGALFVEATANGANFIKSEFYQANFYKAVLRDSNFYRTDLRQTNFSRADVRGVNFARANMKGANFNNADIRGANIYKSRHLNYASFQGAIVDPRQARFLIRRGFSDFLIMEREYKLSCD